MTNLRLTRAGLDRAGLAELPVLWSNHGYQGHKTRHPLHTFVCPENWDYAPDGVSATIVAGDMVLFTVVCLGIVGDPELPYLASTTRRCIESLPGIGSFDTSSLDYDEARVYTFLIPLGVLGDDGFVFEQDIPERYQVRDDEMFFELKEWDFDNQVGPDQY